jgi:diaminohydroxyphosphoribosylaminopyrimidine deaminase/5-amino-6-(5-phosphoribosylamino)uracil reductase
MNLPLPAPADPMRAALALAEQAVGLSEPNPRVGCVIVSADGLRLLGQGHTQAAGSAHAEVMALRDAAARGADVAGATAYVTLEPCSHHGRTPPCCDALIAASLGRVVVAVGDPNPAVNGQGLARLRAAGISVELASAEDAQASRELNLGFFSRMQRARPWVRLKVAGSVDGKTALANGVSQWITSAEARADGHAWRRRAGAVLTGIQTVLADDPMLDVRHVPTHCQPVRVVLDSQLRLPPQARMLQSGAAVWLYTALPDSHPALAAWRERGLRVVSAPAANGRVDLHAVLNDLAAHGINELHVEAGATLNGAFAAAGLVDEWLIYLAPMLLGQGAGLLQLGPWADLAPAPRLRWQDIRQVGPDVRLLARPWGL